MNDFTNFIMEFTKLKDLNIFDVQMLPSDDSQVIFQIERKNLSRLRIPYVLKGCLHQNRKTSAAGGQQACPVEA